MQEYKMPRWTKADIGKAEYIKRVLDEVLKATNKKTIHGRGLHYAMLQQGRMDFPVFQKRGGGIERFRKYGELKPEKKNKDPDPDTLNTWVLIAKRAGYVDYAIMPDESYREDGQLTYNEKYQEFAYCYDAKTPGLLDLLEELKRTSFMVEYESIRRDQPYRFELIVEKSTQEEKILPVCKKYEATYMAFKGNSSWGAAYKLCKRAEDDPRPTLVFYLSDLDPSGFLMAQYLSDAIAEINISEFNNSLDIRVQRIGITPEQIAKYKILPVLMEAGPRVEGEQLEKWEKIGEQVATEELFQAAKELNMAWDPKYITEYKDYLKPLNETEVVSLLGFTYNHRVELDALEFFYPGGVAALVEETFRMYTEPELNSKCRRATEEALDLVESYPVPDEIIAKRQEAIRVLGELKELEENLSVPDREFFEELDDIEAISIETKGNPNNEDWIMHTKKLKVIPA